MLVQGAVFIEGTPDEIMADARRARGLSRPGRPSRSAGAWLTRALELDKVFAGYGETVVLEDIRLTLDVGETLSIIGRNGVGKSTLLATIMGHTTLHGGTRGAARQGYFAARRPTTASRPGSAYVPQEREIFPSLSLRENLEVAARPGTWTIETVFELFPRLAERAGNRGNQLSGGEQQMLAIGRALIGNPTVLLMDEPSEGLAPVIVEELARGGEAADQSRRAGDDPGRAEHAARARHRAARGGDGPRPHRV